MQVWVTNPHYLGLLCSGFRLRQCFHSNTKEIGIIKFDAPLSLTMSHQLLRRKEAPPVYCISDTTTSRA